MKFDSFYGSVPLVGVEVEVQSWRDSKTDGHYSTIVSEMFPKDTLPRAFKDGKHEWRCKCNVCVTIGRQIIWPVQWKVQHDGSLPQWGKEFISSIFPTIPLFVDNAMDSIRSITKNTDWQKGLVDTHGKESYPSFHVHCSVDHDAVPKYYYNMSMLEESQRVMAEYYPELIALASSCGYNRPNIHFRTPRFRKPDDGQDHHIFIAPSLEHFEWRIWEAPPKMAWYYEAAIYVSASLTQAMLNYNVLRALEGVALVNPSPKEEFRNTSVYLQFVNKKRMKALRIAALECSTVVANSQGLEAINDMFDKATKKFL